MHKLVLSIILLTFVAFSFFGCSVGVVLEQKLHSLPAIESRVKQVEVQEITPDVVYENTSFIESLTKELENENRCQENPTDASLNRIDSLEIFVVSKKIKALQDNKDCGSFEKFWPAATAKPKDAKGIPYGKVGRIWKITLNPAWYPPKSIKEEELAKGNFLPDEVPPGKNNPLGKVKLYIKFDGHNSSLGIHNTNQPNSIGKRVTHGCTRLGRNDALEMARIILKQNGLNADELFEKAAKNPKKSIPIEIANGPSVVHYFE